MEELYEEFNSGKYNEIAIGYAMIAVRDLGMDKTTIKEVEGMMRSNYDFIGAKEAHSFYKKN